MFALDHKKVFRSFEENKERIEKRYQEGVEKYRKGDFTLCFSSPGKKKVTIKQKTHKFLFGCNAFMLDSVETPEKEQLYKQKFAALFNHAVVPFYWKDLEPEEGKLRFRKDSENIYRRPAPDVVLEFCKEYDLVPKGHCLAWNHVTPDWLVPYSTEKRKELMEKRFREIAEEYAAKIPYFDIVNESATNYNHGRKTLFEGYDEFCWELSRKYFPGNRKLINEYNYAVFETFATCGKYMPYYQQVQRFLEKGLPIDEIGLQFHMFSAAEDFTTSRFDHFLNAENHMDVLDLFNGFGLPMHMSEITIPCFPDCLPENEEMQAKLTELFYKIWFSTPNMAGIVWWNLADGYAAYAPRNTYEGENYYGGGLLHYDMTEKKAYQVIDRLINKEWKTSFTQDCEKELTFRGFYGKYEITVEDENGVKTVEVDLSNPAVLEI